MSWLNRHFIIEMIAIATCLPMVYFFRTIESTAWLRYGRHIDGVTLLVTTAYALGLLGICLPARKGSSKLGAFALFMVLLFMGLLPAMFTHLGVPSRNYFAGRRTRVEWLRRDASRVREVAYEHEKRGDFDAAIAARKESVWITRKAYGAVHWRLTDANHALAHAETLATFSPVQLERVAEHRQLSERGRVLYKRGDWRAAVQPTRQALEICGSLFGKDSLMYADSCRKLADIHLALGENEEAHDLLSDALPLYTRLLGTGHPHYAAVLYGIGRASYELGDHQSAKTALQEALKISKELMGDVNRDAGGMGNTYCGSLNSLAQLHQDERRFDEARLLLGEAIDVATRTRGKDSSRYATFLGNLGTVENDAGNLIEAERLLREARGILQKAGAQGHPYYASVLSSLAHVYTQTGELQQAEALLNDADTIVRSVFGERHVDRATVLSRIAELRRTQKEYAAAEAAIKEALAIRESKLPAGHPRLADTLDQYARLLRDQSREAEARERESRARIIRAQHQKKMSSDNAQTR